MIRLLSPEDPTLGKYIERWLSRTQLGNYFVETNNLRSLIFDNKQTNARAFYHHSFIFIHRR